MIDPVTAAAMIQAGGQIFGGMMGDRASAQAQKSANSSNERIAQENREFQERMDSTKYQRGVADARAAGFNPLVAFPGSGGSPMGSTATMLSERPNRGELYLAMSSSIAEVAKKWADARLSTEAAKTEKTKQDLNRAETENAKGTFQLPGLLRAPLSGVRNFLSNSVRPINNRLGSTASHIKSKQRQLGGMDSGAYDRLHFG